MKQKKLMLLGGIRYLLPVIEAARVLTLPTYYGLPLEAVRDIARNVLEINE